MRKRVWSTNSLVNHEPEVPEIVRWYMANRLLRSTELLNDHLDGRVSAWVDELRSIARRTQTSWRILGELNKTLVSLPEKMAYEGYHAILDIEMRLRWRALRVSYLRLNAASRDDHPL